jgi:hypothetical protein
MKTTPKKTSPAAKPQPSTKRKPREDFSQAAARIVREATDRD